MMCWSDRRVCCILILLLSLIAFPVWAEPERHAIVIGNASYQDQTPLHNTLNDAKDLEARLRALGFDVTLLKDVTGGPMRRSINRFLGSIRAKSGIALLYCSGHGMQDSTRQSYLLPIDARIDREEDVKSDGVGVNDILAELARRPDGAVSLVLLDACRNNPFSSKRGGRGLGRVTPSGGTLVLYAASPGQTAEDNPSGHNGLFTKHLLEVFDRPGLDIEDGFEQVAIAVTQDSGGTQVPYREGNLLGKHYLAGAERLPPADLFDLKAWESAERCGRPACYRAYLTSYPNGRFRPLAEAMLGSDARPPTVTVRAVIIDVDKVYPAINAGDCLRWPDSRLKEKAGVSNWDDFYPSEAVGRVSAA